MKVFISYSWTPESNKKKVRELAEKLQKNGFEVIIDQTHLKFGYDKYAFMEKMVTDSTISKVLIICNRDYAQKADTRVGGVGDESMIITSELYGKVEQSKFIPVIFEKDTNGKPYLPAYLKRIMYVDLSNKRQYKISYYELVRQMREPFFNKVCDCLKRKGLNCRIRFGEALAEFEIGTTLIDNFVTLITDNGVLLIFQVLISEILDSDINFDAPGKFFVPYGKFYFEENPDAESTSNLVYSHEIKNIESDALQEDILSFIDWLETNYHETAVQVITKSINFESKY